MTMIIIIIIILSLEHGSNKSIHNTNCHWCFRNSHQECCKYLEKINFKPGLDPLQKACLLGTARIIRKVLDYRVSQKNYSTFD